MADSTIHISNGERSVLLPGVSLPSDISVSGETERQKGRSTVRFVLIEDNMMRAEPYDTLALWFEEDAEVTLLVEGINKVGGCRLRECSLDLERRRMYVEIYTPYSAQEVRHWFMSDTPQ